MSGLDLSNSGKLSSINGLNKIIGGDNILLVFYLRTCGYRGYSRHKLDPFCKFKSKYTHTLLIPFSKKCKNRVIWEDDRRKRRYVDLTDNQLRLLKDIVSGKSNKTII